MYREIKKTLVVIVTFSGFIALVFSASFDVGHLTSAEFPLYYVKTFKNELPSKFVM